jgi:hypothetical protein
MIGETMTQEGVYRFDKERKNSGHIIFVSFPKKIIFNKKITMAQRKSQGQGGTSNRGFASMNQEQQRAIARKGGEAVSMNRAHMAEIGRKGGEASGQNRRNAANQNRMNQENQANQQANQGTPSGENRER